MSKAAIQPLESMRFAEYAVPIPCCICGTGNTSDAEFCTHCSAPMALAHQNQDPKVVPEMTAVIGASGAGKTVYLGMLMDMLSRRPHQTKLLARGAFSITLQQSVLSALSQNRFPPKTPNEPDRWNWIHCQVRRAGQHRKTELIMPDMAGEALLEEVDHPHTFRVVRSFLDKCAGAIVMIDTTKILDGATDHSFFTMKLLSYLVELNTDKKLGWSRRPLALVFSKADRHEDCLENPEAFARSKAVNLVEFCEERLRCFKFFSSGVAGTCVRCESMTEGSFEMPLRIEPHGIIEPFEWLLTQLGKKRSWRG